MPKSTQNGGVYLICNLRRCEFCLIILSSFFFFLQRHCDVGPDKMHTPGSVENIRPVPQNVFLAVVDPDGIEVYDINSLGAEETFIYY